MTMWSNEVEEIRACCQRLKGKTNSATLLDEILTYNVDPRSVLTRARSVVEAICLEIGEQHSIKRKKGALDELITELRRQNLIPENILPSLIHVKGLGNLGAHPYDVPEKLAKDSLVSLLTVLSWYEVFVDETSSEQPAFQPAVPSLQAGKILRVVLIYKRKGSLDEQVANLISAGLKSAGHTVLIHGYTTFSNEWQHQVRADLSVADAALILLSLESIYSEMLMYEVEQAYQSAQQNAGKLRLLPIRLSQELPLPQELANLLGSKFLGWRGPDEGQTLLRQILQELADPPVQAPNYELEMVGGAIPLDSKFYIERPADREFKTAVLRRDSIVLIKGARQVGKTSLLARGLQAAREAGFLILLIDLQRFIDSQLQTLETFFITVGEMMADQLNLDVYPQDKWRANRAPNLNFENYFINEILGKTTTPLLWAIDEADRLFLCNFSSEFFALLRTWHNTRALNPVSPCSRLTLAIAYATETYMFIKDPNQSPFNVGTKIVLEDFTQDQVAELNRRYGQPLRSEQELCRFCQLTGGQPYLVRCALNDMVGHRLNLEEFLSERTHEEGPLGDHLRRILLVLSHDPHLAEITRGLLRGKPCPDNDSFDLLRRGGILKGDSRTEARLRCELYELYLRKHLL